MEDLKSYENGKRSLNPSPILTPGKRLKQSCLPFKVINTTPSSSSSPNPVIQTSEKKRPLSKLDESDGPSNKSSKKENSLGSSGSSSLCLNSPNNECKENKIPSSSLTICNSLNPTVVLKKYFASKSATLIVIDSTDGENSDAEPRVCKLSVGVERLPKDVDEVVLTEADTTTELSPSKTGASSTLNNSITDTDGEKCLSDSNKSTFDKRKSSERINEAIESVVNPTSFTDDDDDVKVSLANSSETSKVPLSQRKKKLTKRRQDPSAQLERERLQQEKIKVQLEKERLKAELRRLKDESRRVRDNEKTERLEKKAKEEQLKLEKLHQRDEEKKKKQGALAAKQDEKQKREQEKLDRDEEKKRQDEEKKKCEDEGNKKLSKTRAAFEGFFVKRASSDCPVAVETSSTNQCLLVSNEAAGHFLPFQVKKDVRLAPQHRNPESNSPSLVHRVDAYMKSEEKVTCYLEQLKFRGGKRQTARGTWPADDLDVSVVLDLQAVEKGRVNRRCRLLQFCDNVRPAYWGTWSKKSKIIRPRAPFNKDTTFLDYEVDSDDEWEEEEAGESLSHSENEKESEDDYDVDNEFMVPHGYLSDEEAQDEEHVKLSPDRMKASLKLKEEEFQKELKKKYQQIKPRVVGCFWIGDTSPGMEKLMKSLEEYSAVILMPQPIETTCSTGRSVIETNCDESTENNGVGNSGCIKKVAQATINKLNAELLAKVMPSFVRLVHGSTYGKKILFKEFKKYVSSLQDEDFKESIELQEPRLKVEEDSVRNTVDSVATKPFISELRLKKTLKQIATYGRFPEQGAIFNEMAWCVNLDVRQKYGLADFPIPNAWEFSTDARVPVVAVSPMISENSNVPTLKRSLPKDFFRKKHKVNKVVKVKEAVVPGETGADESVVDLTGDTTIYLD